MIYGDPTISCYTMGPFMDPSSNVCPQACLEVEQAFHDKFGQGAHYKSRGIQDQHGNFNMRFPSIIIQRRYPLVMCYLQLLKPCPQKQLIYVDLPNLKMVTFHSYVSLPEGNIGVIMPKTLHCLIGVIASTWLKHIPPEIKQGENETVIMINCWAKRKKPQENDDLPSGKRTQLWKVTIFKFGKSTISMGNFQQLCQTTGGGYTQSPSHHPFLPDFP